MIDMEKMWAGEIERSEAELDAAEEADRLSALTETEREKELNK